MEMHMNSKKQRSGRGGRSVDFQFTSGLPGPTANSAERSRERKDSPLQGFILRLAISVETFFKNQRFFGGSRPFVFCRDLGPGGPDLSRKTTDRQPPSESLVVGRSCAAKWPVAGCSLEVVGASRDRGYICI